MCEWSDKALTVRNVFFKNTTDDCVESMVSRNAIPILTAAS